MRFALVIPAVAIFAAAMAAPAYAQYVPAYGPGYYGPVYGNPAYRARVFRGYVGPVIEPPFYGDGWVPEPIFDHSRTGGIDPNIRPPN
jgi:hypothetical protein